MPIYDYICTKCGKVSDVWATMDERTKRCPKCKRKMSRLIARSNIITDLIPHVDENMGHEPVYVKSRQHKKQLLKEKGLVAIG